MRQPLFKFLLGIALLTALCVVAQVIWNQRAPLDKQMFHGWALLLPFPLAVTLLHLLLTKPGITPQQSIQMFLASSALKLLIYLGVLVLFLLFSAQNKKVVAVHFLGYYAVFSVYEYFMLLTTLGKKR